MFGEKRRGRGGEDFRKRSKLHPNVIPKLFYTPNLILSKSDDGRVFNSEEDREQNSGGGAGFKKISNVTNDIRK